MEARKDSEASRSLLRDKEFSLQEALAKFSLSVDEGKRLKHQKQLLECSTAHTRLQNRMGGKSTSGLASMATLSNEDILLGGTGKGLQSLANDNAESSDHLHSPRPVPFVLGLSPGKGLGLISSNLSDFDARKEEQRKYNVDVNLGLQAALNAIRQELHKERNIRAQERVTLTLATEEALARATFSETLASDLKKQLTKERERRELADKGRDDASAQQQSMLITMGQKETKVRQLTYEIDLQKERTSRIEEEMLDMAAVATKEKSFESTRTADLIQCVALMRMGIAEAQGELAVQSSISGHTAAKASRESERIGEKLNTLVAEYEELWTHSQRQVACSIIPRALMSLQFSPQKSNDSPSPVSYHLPLMQSLGLLFIVLRRSDQLAHTEDD